MRIFLRCSLLLFLELAFTFYSFPCRGFVLSHWSVIAGLNGLDRQETTDLQVVWSFGETLRYLSFVGRCYCCVQRVNPSLCHSTIPCQLLAWRSNHNDFPLLWHVTCSATRNCRSAANVGTSFILALLPLTEQRGSQSIKHEDRVNETG